MELIGWFNGYYPESLSRIYLGDRDGYNGIISTIKSKNGNTWPSNGLLSFIDNIRKP